MTPRKKYFLINFFGPMAIFVIATWILSLGSSDDPESSMSFKDAYLITSSLTLLYLLGKTAFDYDSKNFHNPS